MEAYTQLKTELMDLKIKKNLPKMKHTETEEMKNSKERVRHRDN